MEFSIFDSETIQYIADMSAGKTLNCTFVQFGAEGQRETYTGKLSNGILICDHCGFMIHLEMLEYLKIEE
jgi:hypothetical protein